MQGEVGSALIPGVRAQSSILDSNRKRPPSSSQCKASCIGGLHAGVESRWIKEPSAPCSTPADGFFNLSADSASASSAGARPGHFQIGAGGKVESKVGFQFATGGTNNAELIFF